MELVITGDGSHTIQSPVFSEYYHSIHGALQESRHVFIDAGLHSAFSKFRAGDISILEIGFGTGLNALLTWIEAEQHKIRISYTTLEPFPLEEDIWSKLNYAHLLGDEGHTTKFSRLHQANWNIPVTLSDFFTICKIKTTLQSFIPAENKYELIYLDAFSPVIQPELWSPAVFNKLAGALRTDGILTTYTVKGIVVRGMKQTGFAVEKLPGPPGKRHILRGVKVWHDVCKPLAP